MLPNVHTCQPVGPHPHLMGWHPAFRKSTAAAGASSASAPPPCIDELLGLLACLAKPHSPARCAPLYQKLRTCLEAPDDGADASS